MTASIKYGIILIRSAHSRFFSYITTKNLQAKNWLILGTIIALAVVTLTSVIDPTAATASLPPQTPVALAQEMEANDEKPSKEELTSKSEAKETENTVAVQVKAKTSLVYSSVEEEVRKYFADTPELIAISYCESRWRHTTTDGTIIRGVVNKSDVGVMQINEYYHKATAQKMGLNLLDLYDNMAYAKYLYKAQGNKPWVSSSECWTDPNYRLKK